MQVRRYDDEDDLRGAIRCYNRAWRVGFRGLVPEAVIEAELREEGEPGVETLSEEIHPQPAELFVAVDDGTVVGYVHARYASTSDHVAQMDGELVELYVDPAHWREGVATALHDRVESWMPDQIEGIVVEVLGENERGQAFLEDRGYEFDDTTVIELNGDLHGAGRYRLPTPDPEDDQ